VAPPGGDEGRPAAGIRLPPLFFISGCCMVRFCWALTERRRTREAGEVAGEVRGGPTPLPAGPLREKCETPTQPGVSNQACLSEESKDLSGNTYIKEGANKPSSKISLYSFMQFKS